MVGLLRLRGILRELSRNVEELGVMVLRSGAVCNTAHRALEADEFRAFAMIDETEALIFINGRDFKGAQTSLPAQAWTARGGGCWYLA